MKNNKKIDYIIEILLSTGIIGGILTTVIYFGIFIFGEYTVITMSKEYDKIFRIIFYCFFVIFASGIIIYIIPEKNKD